MKKNTGKYEIVHQLPAEAMTVTDFAASRFMSQSNIYKKIARKTADYKIVIFKSMNFVIPFTNN